MNKREEIKNLLVGFKEEEVEKNEDIKRKLREWHEQWQNTLRNAEKIMMPNLKCASRDDYEQWLWGYLKSGGRPTHYYDYNFNGDDWYKAIADFKTTPLYGAASFQIIVPCGINYCGGERGHINIYFMEDYLCRGGWIPIYADMI
jgi:hypothetical protein